MLTRSLPSILRQAVLNYLPPPQADDSTRSSLESLKQIALDPFDRRATYNNIIDYCENAWSSFSLEIKTLQLRWQSYFGAVHSITLFYSMQTSWLLTTVWDDIDRLARDLVE